GTPPEHARLPARSPARLGGLASRRFAITLFPSRLNDTGLDSRIRRCDKRYIGVMMSQPLDFQSIILNLQNYWAEQGCLIWQPYYTQVGAGTMNPATYLRVLGPEPWNVAYVEPSVRPDDGRYGENPNRFQLHTQFQVILKPDPGNPQELYLESLKALSIDPRQYDL